MQKFLFGTATSAHQFEGDNIHSDWWKYEGMGNVHSGKACNSYKMYEDDIKIMKSMGVNAYRFSIEWARIEPEEGKFNEEAVKHYQKIVSRLREENIEPIITLHHFTNPLWFYEIGSWEKKENLKYFERYVKYIIPFFKDKVKYWLTVNEPNIYTLNHYFLGLWFPKKKNVLKGFQAYNNMLEAHKRAYKIIHSIQPDAMVSFAHHYCGFYPVKNILYPLNYLATKITNYISNLRPFNSVKGYLDFVSFNYYTKLDVRFSLGAYKSFFIGSDQDMYECYLHYKKEGGKQPFIFYPELLIDALRNLNKLGLPIFISENGFAGEDDTQRVATLNSVFAQLKQARKEGVPVFGYMHWSLIDNMEWDLGHGVHFGLFSYDPETFERKPKPSSMVYKDLLQSFKLDIN